MKDKLKKLIRPGLFLLGGALAGLAYYYFFGCENGCVISSSPWRTMAYMGLAGLLLSGAFGRGCRNGCST